jgi:uncharacterized protein (TIGR00251 family)
MNLAYVIREQLAFIEIKASPNASRTEIAGFQDGRIRIRVAAAPEDGKANAEIRAFLAKKLGCPKSAITIEAGEKSKQKTISIPVGLVEKLRALAAPHDL